MLPPRLKWWVDRIGKQHLVDFPATPSKAI
jgi:hypothetical protein